MKCDKAAGIIPQMPKVAGGEGVELTRQLAKAVFSCSVIIFLGPLYMGKAAALDHGNYRSLKLTDQVMKLIELFLESYIQEKVNIDEM